MGTLFYVGGVCVGVLKFFYPSGYEAQSISGGWGVAGLTYYKSIPATP